MEKQDELGLLSSAGVSHVDKGGVILIPKDEALRYAKKLDSEQIAVLGIDAFKLFDDGQIQPSLANDFPEPQPGSSVLKYVETYLEAVEPFITHFEFVLE